MDTQSTILLTRRRPRKETIVLSVVLLVATFLAATVTAHAEPDCKFEQKISGMYVYRCDDGSKKVTQSPIHAPKTSPRPSVRQAQRPAQKTGNQDLARTDPILYIVQETQRLGFIRKVEPDASWMNVYVSPQFHNEDHDNKTAVMAAFLAWGQRKHKDMSTVFIFDSRDRKRLGSYHPSLGLRVKRPSP